MIPQWIIAKARSHLLSLSPSMHSLTQPYTAMHIYAQLYTAMHSLGTHITFYVRIPWHVIITLTCDYHFGMWFSTLVIFPLEVTNSGHYSNQDDSFTQVFTKKFITNQVLGLTNSSEILPITQKSYQSSPKAYKSPLFLTNHPQFHYQSPTFITNHSISITNHPKPYYKSPPMDYQSTFFLVITKPSVEYKRGPIFWLQDNTVPFI